MDYLWPSKKGGGGVYCTHLVVAFCVIGIDAGAAEAGEQN